MLVAIRLPASKQVFYYGDAVRILKLDHCLFFNITGFGIFEIAYRTVIACFAGELVNANFYRYF